MGWLVPAEVAEKDENKDKRTTESVSAWRALYLGKDNRASTSKAVALAWTYAIVWGLLAALALKLMGSNDSWTALTQDEALKVDYLLLLGGPYAAAVIAKYVAVGTGAADTKTADPQATTTPGKDAKNLISDDTGDTDLATFSTCCSTWWPWPSSSAPSCRTQSWGSPTCPRYWSAWP